MVLNKSTMMMALESDEISEAIIEGHDLLKGHIDDAIGEDVAEDISGVIADFLVAFPWDSV